MVSALYNEWNRVSTPSPDKMLYTMCTVADNYICITITISISLVLVVLDQMTVEVGLSIRLEVTLFTLEGLIVGVLHLDVTLE